MLLLISGALQRLSYTALQMAAGKFKNISFAMWLIDAFAIAALIF